jgi:hypothetical protein
VEDFDSLEIALASTTLVFRFLRLRSSIQSLAT